MVENPADRFNQPEVGTDDWHEPLNENFAKLGTDVEIRDKETARDNYDPKVGAKFFATDTGSIFLGTLIEEADEPEWIPVKTSGENPAFHSVTANEAFHKNQNGIIYARELDGDDLSEKIENALGVLSGGQGRIRVTARDDGRPWQWDHDLTVITPNYEGVHIDVDDNVTIEYTGNGVMLTFDQNGKFTEAKKRAVLTGGQWEGTGDPDGWCRLKDTIRARIEPAVVDFRAGNDQTFGVSLENHERWTESCYITGKYFAGIGIDSLTDNETSGTEGTDSFHGTTIEDVHIHPSNIGIRCRGNWDFCNIRHPEIFLNGDDADGIYLDASRMQGTVILSHKFEQPGGSNGTAIVLGENFDGWHTPLFIGGAEHVANITRDEGAQLPIVPQIRGHTNGIRMCELHTGHDIEFNREWYGWNQEIDRIDITRRLNIDGRISMNDNRITELSHTEFTIQDVRSISEPEKGCVAYHDGSGNNIEGPSFYDGTHWVSQIDGSAIL